MSTTQLLLNIRKQQKTKCREIVITNDLLETNLEYLKEIQLTMKDDRI